MFSIHIHWKKLAFFLLTTFAAAGISALAGGEFTFYGLTKPPLTPPEWVFPVVWSILYLLMAIAAYLVWATRSPDADDALAAYFWQLGINVLWPPLFFRLEWPFFAFLWLVLLAGLVAYTWNKFRKISPAAGWLFVPYLAWTLFAAYLNLGFFLLNN